MRTVMQTRSKVGIGVATAGLLGIGIFAWMLWGSNCPLFLTVIASEPSGMLDDSGSEFQLVTVRINNSDAGRLTLAEEGIRGEAKVGNHWVDAEVLSNVPDVGRQRDLLILVPSSAESCRFAIQYLPEPISLKFMHLCGNLGLWRHSWWRTVSKRCFPVGWLQPRRSDYIGGRSWKHIRPEVSFPHESKARCGGLCHEHKESIEANSRVVLPFVAGVEFECPFCAPAFISAAVAHFRRSATSGAIDRSTQTD